MERPFVCKHLIATYEETEREFRKQPVRKELDIGKDKIFHISIIEGKTRKIKISTESDTSIYELNAVFTRIERLLMLFDGRFFALKEMRFSESDCFAEDSLAYCAQNLKAQRLAYFCSADFCKNPIHRLVNFEEALTSDLFNKWVALLEELGVVHQVFLYAVSDSKITTDVKCAFLIEMAEPILEILNETTHKFDSLIQNKKQMKLKKCLEALIEAYGNVIFDTERTNPLSIFLQTLVNSRVNIMHIKRNQKTPTFNGRQALMYAQKLSLLYRRILFELLGIKNDIYFDRLSKCVESLDNWGLKISSSFFKFVDKTTSHSSEV